MSEDKITITLAKNDAYKVLYLVQREASEGLIWNDYWERVANDIRKSINEQDKIEPVFNLD